LANLFFVFAFTDMGARNSNNQSRPTQQVHAEMAKQGTPIPTSIRNRLGAFTAFRFLGTPMPPALTLVVVFMVRVLL